MGGAWIYDDVWNWGIDVYWHTEPFVSVVI